MNRKKLSTKNNKTKKYKGGNFPCGDNLDIIVTTEEIESLQFFTQEFSNYLRFVNRENGNFIQFGRLKSLLFKFRRYLLPDQGATDTDTFELVNVNNENVIDFYATVTDEEINPPIALDEYLFNFEHERFIILCNNKYYLFNYVEFENVLRNIVANRENIVYSCNRLMVPNETFDYNTDIDFTKSYILLRSLGFIDGGIIDENYIINNVRPYGIYELIRTENEVPSIISHDFMQNLVAQGTATISSSHCGRGLNENIYTLRTIF